jgi:hypothetical protein
MSGLYPSRYLLARLGISSLGVAALLLVTPFPTESAGSGPAARSPFGNIESGSSIFRPDASRSKGTADGTTGLFGHARPVGLLDFLRGSGAGTGPQQGVPALPGAPSTGVPALPGARSTGLVLTGVVIVGDRALGFVQDPALTSNKVVIVREGDTLGPYTIVSIEADRMNVSSAGGALTVRLSRQTGTPGSPTSSAASSRAPAGQPASQGGAPESPVETGVRPQ